MEKKVSIMRYVVLFQKKLLVAQLYESIIFLISLYIFKEFNSFNDLVGYDCVSKKGPSI